MHATRLFWISVTALTLLAVVIFVAKAPKNSKVVPELGATAVHGPLPGGPSLAIDDSVTLPAPRPARIALDEPEAEIHARAIPERYRLPDFPVGMTTGGFLAAYWGAEWPAYEAEILSGPYASNLDNINTKDWTVDLATGSIEDFFDGLLERTLTDFQSTYADLIYSVPGTAWGSYLDANGLLKQILISKAYNPQQKKLSATQKVELASLIEERSQIPMLFAGDVLHRWKYLIAEDVAEIVQYREPIHSKAFISPLVSLAWNAAPAVAQTAPYPAYDISLPPVLRTPDSKNAAGFFAGFLTMWAGYDAQLVHLYNELPIKNDTFKLDIRQFIANL